MPMSASVIVRRAYSGLVYRVNIIGPSLSSNRLHKGDTVALLQLCGQSPLEHLKMQYLL